MRAHVTAADFATSEIRRLIIERELAPGSRIDQTDMAERLGVSRIPIRQALVHLAERKFVVLSAHRGAVVAPISIQSMRDLYALRWHLETWAFEQYFTRFDEQRIQSLEDLVSRGEKAAERGDLEHFTELNHQFHLELYRISENEHLYAELTRLFSLSERYHWACLSDPDALAASQQEHRELVDRIRAGDLSGFLAHCRSHNEKTIEWIEKTEPLAPRKEA